MPWKTGAVVAIASIVGIGLYVFALHQIIAKGSPVFERLGEEDQEWCNASQGTGIEHFPWHSCGEAGQTLEERPDTCGKPCYEKSFLEEVREFQAANTNGVKVVNYTSRPGPGYKGPLEDAHLIGWWLPAPDGFTDAPRVVFQHGNHRNAFHEISLLFSFALRSLGLGVLSNNLRNHCDQDYLEAWQEWGHAYPYDLLGAWDYAVDDPDRELGGSRAPNRVGLMGFSLGGFLAATAFGLEGDIPAVAVDSPVYSPRDALVTPYARKEIEELLGFATPDWLLLEPAYSFMLTRAKWARGINYEQNLPEDVLPLGPATQRPIYISTNRHDGYVLWETNSEALINLLEGYPQKYDVTSMYYDNDSCINNNWNHGRDLIREPDMYIGKLCTFWKKVFDLPVDQCTSS